ESCATWTARALAELPNLAPAVVRGLALGKDRRFLRLDLSGVRFNSDQLQRILDLPALNQVEDLRLGWDGGPTHPGPLTHLDLGWVLPWEKLRLLDLKGQGIGSEGVRGIARREEAADLRWLRLAADEHE